MKTLFWLLTGAVFCLASCQKLVEQQKKDLLIKAITTGQWEVESYVEGTIPVTDQFAGYAFRFNENGTVISQKNDTLTNGTWVGDAANYSIASQFPGVGDPLKKLNGTWLVTDGSFDRVVAEMHVADGIALLRLRKQ